MNFEIGMFSKREVYCYVMVETNGIKRNELIVQVKLIVKQVVRMLLLLLLLSVLLVAHQPTTVSSKAILKRTTGQTCHVGISYYPLNEMQLEEAPGDADATIRSYYNSFTTGSQMTSENTFKVSVEYKKPKVSMPAGTRRVVVDWYNLLFTASIQISKTSSSCEKSYLGFVELVETDAAWYKSNGAVNICSEPSLASTERLFVMTKQAHKSNIFANDNSKVQLFPSFMRYNQPIKYESSESIVIDFNQYPNTDEYERLIKKKVFLVHTDLQYNVLDVIIGVDVMMYLHYHTNSITPDGRQVNLMLKKDHSLFQRIINPEKYARVLNDKANQVFRDINLTHKEWFQSHSEVASLDPLPENVDIVTQ